MKKENKIKKYFSKWSTKKKTLWFAILVCIIYAIADCIVTMAYAYTGAAIYFDSTLTTELFSLMKWVVGVGGGLSATGIVTETIKDIYEERG